MHEKLTDINQIRAYNAIKEQKLKAFATYLLIAWLTTNIIFVQVRTSICVWVGLGSALRNAA